MRPPSRDRVLTDDEYKILGGSGGLTTRSGRYSECFWSPARGVKGRRHEVVRAARRSVGDPRRENEEQARTIVPLPPMAQELLPKGTMGDFVFSTTGSTPASGFSRAKRRLDLALQIPPWRVSDCGALPHRNGSLGQPVHVVEAVLNHKSGTIRGVAAVYNRYS